MSLMQYLRQGTRTPESGVVLSDEDVERILDAVFPRRSWSYYYALLGGSVEQSDDGVSR